MTEYKTFDDYVRNIFKVEPSELTHLSPEEQKKKTVKITVDELINIWNELTELESKIKQQEQQLTKAKELIKNIIRVTWSEGWSYSLDVKVKAEQFLKEVSE